MCVAPFVWSGAGDYPSRPRGGAQRWLVGGDDDAEVLRVQRSGLPFGERGGRVRRDPDAGVAEAGVEDVGAVAGRGHPGFDDRPGSGEPEGAPGDVLADDVTDLGAVDVAAGANSVQRGGPLGRDVREVVLAGHVFAVALGGVGEVDVGGQRALAVAGAFAVDQAEDGGADLFEVAGLGREVGVGARAGGERFRGGGFGGGGFGGNGVGRRGRPGGEGRGGGEGRPGEAGRTACGGRVGVQARGRRHGRRGEGGGCHTATSTRGCRNLSLGTEVCAALGPDAAIRVEVAGGVCGGSRTRGGGLPTLGSGAGPGHEADMIAGTYKTPRLQVPLGHSAATIDAEVANAIG